MTPHQEIEVKLRVDAEKLAQFRRSRWWRGLGPVRRQSLHSSYFDTDDHDLHERSITLRTRTDGKGVVQTIKMREDAADSVSRREWEALIPDPVPDPSLVIDPALPDAFRKLTSADLHAVFDIDVKRETRRLESERVQIDISLDDGAVVAGPERERIHEVELELVTGGITELFAEARRLSDSIDGRLHARAKSDTGYALIAPDRRTWSKAAKLSLTPDMTAGQAFQRIILNGLSHLTANDDCARLNLHVEGVHQCRIALRRLRSALKIYGKHLPGKRIKPIEDDVRWLGGILGVARDLDVLQTQLIAPAMESLGEGEQLGPLLANLNGKKSAAYAQLGEALSSERYRHFLIDLCALGHSADLDKAGRRADLAQPLTKFASQALSRQHAKLLKRGRRFETLSKAERHKVRIALKRLRYAVDFFGDVFDAEGESMFFKRLSRLQDDLGGMNDVAVAESMLMRLIGVQGDGASDPAAPQAPDGMLVFAAGTILGWHRRRAAEIDRKLIKDWRAFVRAKPFWLDADGAAA